MRKSVVILLIVIVIIAAAAVFVTFFYYPKCGNLACWESKMINCRHAQYINDDPDIAWQYKILGKSGGKCIVNVEVLKVKQGLTKVIVMENKDMDCEIPIGLITPPEADPTICHGILKEEMQTLIIEKLHQYILANVGVIGEELGKISSSSALNLTTGTNSTNSSG